MSYLLAETRFQTRRHFLRHCQLGFGAAALGSLLPKPASGKPGEEGGPLEAKRPPRGAKAKRVIYLHMAGSPPQHELFDYKPKLVEQNMKPCPEELMKGQRFPFIKGHPKLLGTPYQFARHGEAGIWVSELLPHFAGMADDVTVVKSMRTTQFNHAPAQLYLYTGSPRFGSASMGSWVTYGLGSEAEDLPAFVVLITGGSDPSGGKSLWGSGFLPSVYQGVQCRTTGEPILYVNDPSGMTRQTRRRSLDALRELNRLELEEFGDPETLDRINQYELAYRMQIAVPEVMDISRETQATLEEYGAKPGQARSFANTCLLARRLAERGVRFVQLFNYGWDMHGTNKDNDLITATPKKCREIDRPIAALLRDLKRRGLLDETLVVFSGEFGRTSMNEERNGSKFLGRDHHPHCFTIWMAGGGVKRGFSYGETDELGYFVAENPVGVHDLQATILHLLGFDPRRFSYPYQGLDQRLIGPTDEGRVRRELLG